MSVAVRRYVSERAVPFTGGEVTIRLPTPPVVGVVGQPTILRVGFDDGERLAVTARTSSWMELVEHVFWLAERDEALPRGAAESPCVGVVFSVAGDREFYVFHVGPTRPRF